ncbi:histidine kinase [uncultured Croceitalea sp.]|uniref:sensor histidine kinase n=1 Tax=uncultured Croceitalea sp. TaxID=1798908 RepID=UPI0033066535
MRKWIHYGVALLIVFVVFEVVRLLLHFAFAKTELNTMAAILNELQSQDSLIFGKLNPLISSLQFSLVYRFTRDWIVNNVVIDRLKTEKLQMELSVLKAQINPHFLFNSLNALDDLIDRNPGQAKKYLNRLSKIYRYTLTSMDEDVVSLEDELDFIDDYIFLLEERFGGMYVFEKDIQTESVHKYLIPPASLQLLLENAVKHNYGSLEEPLKITILVVENEIKVHHLKRLKRTEVESTGKGLENIKKRFQFLSNKSVQVEDTETHFSVKLPLIKNIRPI